MLGVRGRYDVSHARASIPPVTRWPTDTISDPQARPLVIMDQKNCWCTHDSIVEGGQWGESLATVTLWIHDAFEKHLSRYIDYYIFPIYDRL